MSSKLQIPFPAQNRSRPPHKPPPPVLHGPNPPPDIQRRLWLEEVRRLAPSAPLWPGSILRRSVVARLTQLHRQLNGQGNSVGLRLQSLLMPAFKDVFVFIEVYERYNFIRPEIPTNIWAVWVPRDCLDPNVLRDYQDFPRRALPEDTRVQDLQDPAVLYDLPRDDQYRLADSINEQRKSADRDLQSGGFTAQEADQVPDDKPWWNAYLTWIGAEAFLVAGLVVVLFRSGG